jgi:6-phosphogluconolactonase
MTLSRLRTNVGLALAVLFSTLTACDGGVPVTVTSPATPAAPPLRVWVGTYTGTGSRGIYRFAFDPASGERTPPALAGETANPSFLAFHPGGRFLYAVNELKTFGGAPTGAVSAFAVDGATGDLVPLGQQASGGADPCHLVVDRAGRNVLVANYSGGTVAVLPLDPDGRLRPAVTIRRHAGTGPNKARQEAPHAHGIFLDPAERFAFASDLGADKVFVYRWDAGAGALEPSEPAAASLEPGSGPRHLAWHPAGTFVYALNELASTVTAFRYDAGRGTLEPFQTLSTLPPATTGAAKAAEIVVSADGRFLYASNRGDDSLAYFAIDAASGRLSPAGHVPTGGLSPRHFAIDPSGRWLLVANEESDSITFFRLDAETGRPEPVGAPLVISKPVCVLFAPAS